MNEQALEWAPRRCMLADVVYGQAACASSEKQAIPPIVSHLTNGSLNVTNSTKSVMGYYSFLEKKTGP